MTIRGSTIQLKVLPAKKFVLQPRILSRRQRIVSVIVPAPVQRPYRDLSTALNIIKGSILRYGKGLVEFNGAATNTIINLI